MDDKECRFVYIEDPKQEYYWQQFYCEFSDGILVDFTDEEYPMQKIFDMGITAIIYDKYTGPWKSLEEYLENKNGI